MSATEAPPVVVPVAPPPRRRHRWRRRLLWCAALVVALRVALGFSLPWVADLAVKGLGLRLCWQSASLSLCGGSLEIEDLTVAARAAPQEAPPLVKVARIAVDVEMLSLLSLPTLRVAAVDGLRLRLERGADGRLVLPPELIAPPEAAPAAPAAPASRPAAASVPSAAPATAAAATDSPWALPFRVRVLRIYDLRCEVLDPALPGAHRVDLHGDVLLQDLGDPARQAHLLARFTSPQMLDQLRVEAHAVPKGSEATANLDVDLRGLRLRVLDPWLRAAGIEPVAHSHSGSVHVTAHTGPCPADRTARAHSLRAEVELVADGEPWLGVRQVSIECDREGPGGVAGVRAEVAGVRGAAERRADGKLLVAGIALGGGQERAPAPPPVAEPPSPGLEFAGVRLAVSDCTLRWRDLAAPEPLDLALQVESIDAGPFCAGGKTPASLKAKLHVPGIADDVTLTTSELSTDPADLRVRARLALAGITLAKLEPMLRAAGLECTLEKGRLDAELTARVRATASGPPVLSLELGDLRIADRGREVVLRRVAVEELRIDPDAQLISVGSVAVDGPTLAVERERGGALEALGVRFVPAPASTASSAPSRTSSSTSSSTSASTPSSASAGSRAIASPPAAASRPRGLRFELRELRWHGADVAITDRALDPPVALALRDVSLVADGVVAGRAAAADRGGRIRLSASLPGVVEKLSLDGKVAGTERGLSGRLELRGERTTLRALAPYLAAAGLESTLEDGKLAARVGFELGDASGGSFTIDDLAVHDGARVLASLGHAELSGLGASDARGARIERAVVSDLLLTASRDRDGGLAVPGLRLLARAGAEAVADMAAAPGPPAAEPAAAGFTLSSLRLDRCRVQWRDARLDPAIDLDAMLSVRAEPLALGPGAPPTELAVDVTIPGSIERVGLQGTVTLDPARLAADLTCKATDLSGKVLRRYLPPDKSVTLEHGTFDAQLSASATPHPQGGLRFDVAVKDLRLADAEAELVTLRALRTDVARLDLASGIIDVGAVTAEGLRAKVRRTADGLEVGALVLGPGPDAAEEAGRPLRQALPAGLELPRPDLAPLLRLGALDVAVEQIEYTDARSGAESTPLRLALQLRSTGPWQSDIDDPMRSKPLPLELRAALAPLCRQLVLRAEVSPLAAEPRIEGDLRAEGLDTRALLALSPQLAGKIAPEMEDGRLSVRFVAELDLQRRRAIQYDFSRPFALTARLEKLELRSAADEHVLAGVDAVDVDISRIDPASGSVIVRRIEIDTPRLQVVREASGLHAFGLCFPPQPGPGAPNEATERGPERGTKRGPPRRSPAAGQRRRRPPPGPSEAGRRSSRSSSSR
jgi:hypothetical protein